MSEDEAVSPRSSDAAATPEGHTQEKPAPTEAGEPGAPGHVDDHHGEPRLGPIDWAAWGYAAAGVLAGLLVVALFWLKTS